jgi:hypothetical protein
VSAQTFTASWSAAKPNGVPVTGYRVKLSRTLPGTYDLKPVATKNVGASARSVEFPGLARGWVYFFEVQANSRAGFSKPGYGMGMQI